MPGLFFDFHYPLEVKNLLEKLIREKKEKRIDSPLVIDSTDREWISQPRLGDDPKSEVLTINFKLPLSVSELSVDILRRNCVVEFFYLDRSNNWLPVLDTKRYPISIHVSGESTSESWYKYTSSVYPIVAKSIRAKIKRVPDPTETNPYSVGLKTLLIKRNVRERGDALFPFEEEQDVLGNVVSKHVKDWGPEKALDNNATTFWKSEPQPDPSAVVSFFMDVRGDDGESTVIDRVYLDPVYTGQTLNIYTSVDDSKPTRTALSYRSLEMEKDVNTEWVLGQGLRDIVGSSLSQFTARLNYSPLHNESFWIGCEWSPDFDSNDTPSLAPVLFKSKDVRLEFSPSTSRIQLKVGSKVWSSDSLEFKSGDSLIIVAGLDYGKGEVVLRVSRESKSLSSVSFLDEDFPQQIDFGESIGVEGFRGTLYSLIVKRCRFGELDEAYLDTPYSYVAPNPTLRDELGNKPYQTTDNTIALFDWRLRQNAIGGVDDSEFYDKVWEPVWRDYVVQKGFIFFPEPVLARYLKFEFSRLTEEPYPIYESGISTQYKTFPIEVEQKSWRGPSIQFGRKDNGLFGITEISGNRNINWFDPESIKKVLHDSVKRNYSPVTMNVGRGVVTDTYPGSADSPISRSVGAELTLDIFNTYTETSELTGENQPKQEIFSLVKSEGYLKHNPFFDIDFGGLALFTPKHFAIEGYVGSPPSRGSKYWIVPGRTLRIPSTIMKGLTRSSTVTELKATLDRRTRFTTSSTHRYDIRTVQRDSAIAYFAGLREIQPFTSSYIDKEDRGIYQFPFYTYPWELSGLDEINPGVLTSPSGKGVAKWTLRTTGKFSRVKFNFRDSGFLRSDAMWQSAGSTELSRNTSLFPPELGAAWSDSFARWGDTSEEWGSPRSQVSVNLDGNRTYRGRRVLRFSRAAGSGEAGLRVKQSTNILKNDETHARIRSIFVKPLSNDNLVQFRLIDTTNDIIVYEEYAEVQAGAWTEYTSKLFTIPPSETATYEVQVALIGDSQEEFFLADLYTEVSHIQYLAYLGDFDSTSDPLPEKLIDFTSIRDEPNGALVSQEPINNLTVFVKLKSERQFLYGLDLMPQYLQ